MIIELNVNKLIGMLVQLYDRDIKLVAYRKQEGGDIVLLEGNEKDLFKLHNDFSEQKEMDLLREEFEDKIIAK
tara:strand:+ start:301 stop:519 length:219 start_codon:yes stop_codon:yes gene_type:complete